MYLVRYLFNIMYKKDLVQGSTCYEINPVKRIILHGRLVVMMIWVIENEIHSHFNT